MVGTLIGVYLCALFVFNISDIRKNIVAYIEAQLASTLNTEISIADIEFSLFNRIAIKDLKIYDQDHELALTSKYLSAKIKLVELIKGNISFSTILLMDTNINLYKETQEAPLNIQFILDALQTDENTSEKETRLGIGSLIITRANMAYHHRWTEQTPERFNQNHISIKDLNTNISIKTIQSDSINVRLRNLSAKEQSGFEIKALSFNLTGNQQRFEISNLNINLPNTLITSAKALALEGNIFNPSNSLKDYRCKGQLTINKIHTNDFIVFDEHINNLNIGMSGKIKFHTDGNGAYSDILLKEQDFDSSLKLQVGAYLANNKIESVDLNLKQALINEKFTERLTQNLFQDHSTKDLVGILNQIGQLKSQAHVQANIIQKTLIGNVNCSSPTLGEIELHVAYNHDTLSTTLKTQNTEVADLLKQDFLPKHVTLSGHAQMLCKDTTHTDIIANMKIVEAQLHDELLKDIDLSCSLKQNKISAKLLSDNPALTTELQSALTLTKDGFKDLSFEANIDTLSLEKLGITDFIWHGLWRGNVTVVAPKWSKNEKHLHIKIDSLNINRESPYFLSQFDLKAELNDAEHSFINLKSDFLDIDAHGAISSQTILSSLKNTLASHISLWDNEDVHSSDKANVRIKVKNNNFFTDVLYVPLKIKENLEIEATLNTESKLANFTAYADEVNYDGLQIVNPRFYFYSDSNNAYTLFKGKKEIMGEDILLEMSATLRADSLTTELNWDDQNNKSFNGNLRLNSVFQTTEHNKHNIKTHFSPTFFTLNDTTWNVSAGRIEISDAHTIIDSLILKTVPQNSVSNTSLSAAAAAKNRQQSLIIGGTFSKTQHDSINIKLSHVDISDILDFVNFDDVLFDGSATGNVVLKLGENQPFLNAYLNVEGFQFNHALMGNAEINGQWMNTNDDILLNAEMTQNNEILTKVDGFISPAQKGLNLNIHAYKTNLYFLNTWVTGIANDIHGWAKGYCNLFGPFKKLDFKGDINANVSTYIPSNGVKYTINDAEIGIQPGFFMLKNSSIADDHGGKGTITASLSHEHLKKFNYALKLTSDDLLLYDRPSSAEMPFSAQAYASGTTILQGGPKQLNLNIDVTPRKESIIVYSALPENLNNSTNNVGYIKFRNRHEVKDTTSTQKTTNKTQQNSALDFNLKLKINTNNNLKLRVLMSEVDSIEMRGHGILNADYNSNTFNLRGIYNIDDGEYKMNIYNVAKRKFALQSGSTINFNGNTDNAALDLKAVYKLQTASLSDLNIGDNFSERSTPVDCILNITGTPNNPLVNFDLDLPTKNEDEKRMVRSLISTQENLNIQIFSLLMAGRFYTNDYTQVATETDNQNQTTVMANSFLSSTLSTEINEMLTNLLGAKNWNFGTNLSTGTSGWSDMEVKGLVSANLFNNRVQFDGNFGYQERKYNVTNNDNFVGDFNLRCKLTPSGAWGVKFYSKSNERYFTKSTLTTQGVGLEFKKDFKKFIDLFKRNNK